MRFLVTGSRRWTDLDTIIGALAQVILDSIDDNDLPVLVHGHCPTGADAMADEYWGGPTERYPAEWDALCRPTCRPNHRIPWAANGRDYCPAAGVYRNQQMLDTGIDLVLAFPLPGGTGTQDMIRRAEKAGVEVRVYAPRDMCSPEDESAIAKCIIHDDNPCGGPVRVINVSQSN